MPGLSDHPRHRAPLTRQAAIGGAVVAALTLCSALALPRAMARFAHPHAARRSAMQAEKLMLRCASAYRGPAEAAELPAYSEQHIPVPAVRADCTRAVWTGYVNAGGQKLVLLLNDTTGNLICAFNQGELLRQGQPLPAAPVDTAEQAVSLSMETARAFELIPDGSEVALAGVPARRPRDSTWRVEWRVRRSAAEAPHNVVVTLQRANGHLISAVDFREVSAFADR